MNGRQAAKAAAERIEQLEQRIAQDIKDIKIYNVCILHMINHGSPCDFCYDKEECRETGKDLSIGCDEWMIGDVRIVHDGEEGASHEGERILSAGEIGGACPEGNPGEGQTL